MVYTAAHGFSALELALVNGSLQDAMAYAASRASDDSYVAPECRHVIAAYHAARQDSEAAYEAPRATSSATTALRPSSR